jgi:hypothetical protein
MERMGWALWRATLLSQDSHKIEVRREVGLVEEGGGGLTLNRRPNVKT